MGGRGWEGRAPGKGGGGGFSRLGKVGKLTRGMICQHKSGKVKLKGGECSDVLPFIVELIRNHAPRIKASLTDSGALVEAGETLIAWARAFKGRGRLAAPELCNELGRLCDAHLKAAKKANVKMFPKHHAFKHMSRAVCYKGSPNHYATWLDESLNAILSHIAASIHKNAMERKSFQKFEILVSGK